MMRTARGLFCAREDVWSYDLSPSELESSIYLLATRLAGQVSQSAT
jgi:hypothetical protein